MKRAAGPFEILEILGEGSFGTVCVARVTGDPLRRKVALKILKGTYARNQKILNRTRDEARLLSRINHPNIVRVERLMDVGGRPVVVMECVQGVSLDQLILRFKDGLPASIAIETTRQCFLALHVAYNEALGDDGRPLRVIHRDIKPSNMLLSIHGELKVVDFGIAKGEFEGREAETESVVMGSRPYMAPERLDGISDSPAVDTYSAGMSLFELMTGRTMSLSINPVAHEQAMNRQLAYLQVDGMAPESVEDLRNIIRRMCAYDRDYRPTALECARDLEQVIYAIDPEKRISLEEFARTTVQPIYESRPRIAPEEAVQHNEDGEFLKEVTGQLTNGGTGARSNTATVVMSWTPYIVVTALVAVVALLAGVAALKIVTDRELGFQASSFAPAPMPDDGKVAVEVWIPSDAQADIGGTFLSTAGKARVFPGPTIANFYYEDGRALSCDVDARDGMALRLVEDAGKRGITIDDGSFRACDETAAATADGTVSQDPG